MASLDLDIRKLANKVTVEIELKNTQPFRFGLILIRLGCWMSGLQYKELA